MPKNWQKILEKSGSTCLKPISPCHFQNPKPGFRVTNPSLLRRTSNITQNNLSPKILRQEIATVGDEGYKKSEQGPLSFAKIIHSCSPLISAV